jgi:methionyl-tRNA synthetase
MSYSGFIRTSDQEKHFPTAQKIWKRLEAKGDIYKDSYTGKYCVGCETFLQESDCDEEGKCLVHKTFPEDFSETNYFFRLSKYSDIILKLIESETLKIVPEFRKQEILALLKNEGLKDVSFSRSKKTLPWGVPVPNDDDQVMYVWCDALTNYLSVLDYTSSSENFKKFWNQGEVTHIIGKDIFRFHCALWIGMLLSADIKLPQNIAIHGFLLSDGEKMSKTLGNVIEPFSCIEECSLSAVRFFLLSSIPFGKDGDISLSRITEYSNAFLANNLGNAVSRIRKLFLTFEGNLLERKVSHQKRFLHITQEIENMYDEVFQSMESFAPHKALESIMKGMSFVNKVLDEEKPWILGKENPQEARELLGILLEVLYHVSYLLEPFVPEVAQKMQKVLGVPKKTSFSRELFSPEWKSFGEGEAVYQRR